MRVRGNFRVLYWEYIDYRRVQQQIAELADILKERQDEVLLRTALAGGEVNFGFTSMPSAVPLINANRIRALAVTSEKRMPALPATPTMREAGVPPPPGLDIREWYGVIMPAGTPAVIVERLNAEMIKVFKRPDVQKPLTEIGAEYVGSSPEALNKQLANDVRTWAKWVKDAGVRVE